ncbi:variable surface protein [Plasmodium gonderi]|uniref:Variable surface protein n=1 Tax=Plasmodium gonderi TaxID=77519 RepID=A0A1Y1JSM4_PLAGO|nr:variable surface protein [Plasmodium gonderi]GAW84455.1 variable surface protein [Plasmodium gonderi]
MAKSIYESIYLTFSECKNVMDYLITQNDLFVNSCNNIKSKYLNVIITNSEAICCQAMKYLYQIYSKTSQYDGLNEVFFKYFFYWLYKHTLNEEKYTVALNDFYSELIEIAHTNPTLQSYLNTEKKNYMFSNLHIIKDIDDIKKEIANINEFDNGIYDDDKYKSVKKCHDIYNNLRSTCGSNCNSELNSVLELIRKDICDEKLVSGCNISTSKILPTFQKYNLVICTSVTLFTPYGSYLYGNLKRTRNAFKHTYEKNDIMHPYEPCDDDSWNRRYNVLYNSS